MPIGIQEVCEISKQARPEKKFLLSQNNQKHYLYRKNKKDIKNYKKRSSHI